MCMMMPFYIILWRDVWKKDWANRRTHSGQGTPPLDAEYGYASKASESARRAACIPVATATITHSDASAASAASAARHPPTFYMSAPTRYVN